MTWTPAPPTAKRSTLAMPTQPGTTIALKAQRKLTSFVTTPVNLAPRPAWVAQLGANSASRWQHRQAGQPRCSTATSCRNRQCARFRRPWVVRPARRRASFAAARAPSSRCNKVSGIDIVECVADRKTSSISNKQSFAGEIIWRIAAFRTWAWALTFVSDWIYYWHYLILFIFYATPLGPGLAFISFDFNTVVTQVWYFNSTKYLIMFLSLLQVFNDGNLRLLTYMFTQVFLNFH